MCTLRAGRFCSGILWAAGLGLALLAHASGAHAQRATLAVLGLTSEEGDDRLAAELTTALRESVANDASLRLHKSRVSLAQMTLLHDCEIGDADCRTAIGAEVGADQVLYGTLRQAGSRHEVELHLFVSKDGSERNEHRMLALASATAEQRAAYASSLLQALLSPAAPEPEPVAAEQPPPQAVEPAPRPQPVAAKIAIDDPPAAASSSSNDWLGWSLLGVAAVSTGLTIYSWTQIQRSLDDEELGAYKRAIGRDHPELQDVCTEADHDVRHGNLSAEALAHVREACARGETFDVLQYVFLGAAVLSAGTGVYLLLDDEGETDPSVRASIGPNGGLVSLHGSF
jgi:hypothetical protein